jgi:DNA-binding transcriptional ArsR family regulator
VLDAQRIIGLLAEPQRLKMAAALSLGSTTANQVVSATGVELRDVLDALDRLTNSGLVEQSGEEFLLLEAAFKMAARSAKLTRTQQLCAGISLTTDFSIGVIVSIGELAERSDRAGRRYLLRHR